MIHLARSVNEHVSYVTLLRQDVRVNLVDGLYCYPSLILSNIRLEIAAASIG